MKKLETETQYFTAPKKQGELSGRLQEKEILSQFSRKEQKEIKYKQRVLSSLAYFIGKDFEIPVELNQPGGGWHWNFKDNKIGIDPKDLLEKLLDYLRYLICHEGSHRRISRTDFIPPEIWKQPGFSFMMNAIEDPRVDNFVAENYPKFRQFSKNFHSLEIEKLENKYREKAKEKLGQNPRFLQAGYEYLRLWFRETEGQAEEISNDLPEEVRSVVRNTISSAKDSWWRYPAKKEADSGEEFIKKYAEVSYEINFDEIWPEFKKLVEEDMKDQSMQELLKDMQSKEKEEGKGQGVSQQLKDNLTPRQQKELENAIDKALEEAKEEGEKNKAEAGKQEGEPREESEKGEGEPQEGKDVKPDEISQSENFSGKSIDLDSLSEGLKQKIKEYKDSLPPEKRKELGQFLILRVDKEKDGTKLSMKRMQDILSKKFEEEGEGKVFWDTDWYEKEEFFTGDSPKLSWALTSKEVIPNSTDKNYLQQTEEIIVYLKEQVFRGEAIPKEYKDAITEFTDQKERIEKLIEDDWKEAAKLLEGLQINQLIRQSPVEFMYDILAYFRNNKERLFEDNIYTWTRRRASDGKLVLVGAFGSDGVFVSRASGPTTPSTALAFLSPAVFEYLGFDF